MVLVLKSSPTAQCTRPVEVCVCVCMRVCVRLRLGFYTAMVVVHRHNSAGVVLPAYILYKLIAAA